MIAAEIVLILLLVLLNGFFSMSEMARVSAKRARLNCPNGTGGFATLWQRRDWPNRCNSTRRCSAPALHHGWIT